MRLLAPWILIAEEGIHLVETKKLEEIESRKVEELSIAKTRIIYDKVNKIHFDIKTKQDSLQQEKLSVMDSNVFSRIYSQSFQSS